MRTVLLICKNLGKLIPLVALFATWGCATRQLPPPASPAQIQAGRQILSRWSGIQSPPRSLSAYTQVKVEARGRRRSFDAALLAQYPGQLRVEILDDLGRQQFVLVADGQNIFWEDLNSGETSRMAQKNTSLKKSLGIPMTVDEFVDRILLKVPQAELIALDHQGQPVQWILYRSLDQLTLAGNPLRLAAYQRQEAGRSHKERYRISYQYGDPQVGAYPQAYLWHLRKPKAQVFLFLEEAQWNQTLGPEKFRIPPRALYYSY